MVIEMVEQVIVKSSKIMFMRRIILSLVVCCLSVVAFGQTVTVLDPTGNGGFEAGTSTFAANGWSTAQSGVARVWQVGTAAGASSGTKAAYIGTASLYGSNAASSGIHHFYRDITIPAGATNVLLSFALRYTSVDNTYDYFYVYTTGTSGTPVAGSMPVGTQRFVNTATTYNAFTDMATINLTALAGTTFRLVFSFLNEGFAPHSAAAVDKISLTYTAPCSAPSISGGTSPFCVGSTTVLTSGTGGGVWASSNGTVASITTSGATCTVNGLTAGTSNISYTVSGCSGVRTVTVDPIPASFTITPATTGVCPGTSQSLTAPAITALSGSLTLNSSGPLLVSDNTPAGVTSSVTSSLPSGAVITSMSVLINATMSASAWISDLTINLVAPNGQILNLFNQHGGSGGSMANTVISSSGVTSLASSSSPFTGTFAATAASGVGATSYPSNTTTWTSLYSVPGGTWMLAARDHVSGDVPTITSWSITFNYTLPGARTWAPLAGLYTDAGMTTAYTGTNTNTVYASPASATVYTATAIYPGYASCARTATSNVTINPTVSTPITGTLQACAGGASSALSNATGGGAWSGGTVGIATISGGGVVTTGGTAGTARMTYTVGGMCPVTAVFTVNAAPSAIGGTTSVCMNATTTLTNAGGIGTWTSSNSAVGTVGASSGIVTGITAGTTAISYSNGCGTPVGTVVTVLQTGSITGTNPSCAGAANTLSGGTAGTWASSNGSVATINSSGVVNPLLAGTTVISFTPTNGCPAVGRVQTVSPAPTGLTISPATTAGICLGASGTFTASATVGVVPIFSQNFNSGMGTWTVDNTGITSASTLSPWQIQTDGYSYVNFTGTPFHTPDNSAFVLTNSDAGGSGSNTESRLISPVFSLAAYSAASLSFQQWYQVWASGDANVSVDISTDGGGSYTTLQSYLGTAQGTPTAFVTTNVSLNAYAGMSNLRLRFYYKSTWGYGWAVDNVAISGNPRPTYTWTGISGATGLACSICGATTVTPTAAGANVYSVTADYNGCAVTSGITVTIPTINTYTVTGGGSYCAGGSGVSIGLNGSQTGISYALKNSGGTTVNTQAGTGGAITFANQTAASTYTVQATSSSPTCNANMSGSAVVSIDPLPTTPTVTASPATVACYSATLTANNGGSGTMYYQGTNPSGTSTASATNTVNVTTSGTYYFRPQSAAGCWGNSASVAVTINSCVDVTNFSTSTANVCKGLSTTVTVNSTTLVAGSYTVTYTLSGANSVVGATAPITMSGGSATFAVPASSLTNSGLTTITITAVSDITSFSASPSSGNVSSFTVYALPADVTVSGAGTFCGSTSISATNGSDGTIFFQGTTSNGTSTGLGGSPQTITTVGANTYYFRARSSDGCWGNQGSAAVTINTIPTAAPTNSGPICSGGTVTLNANPATGASTYSWTGPNSFSSTNQNPSATPTVTSVYSLTVTDGSGNPGCSPSTVYTTEVTVKPKPMASPSNNGYICAGGSALLTASPIGGATVFSWSGTPISSATAENPTANPTTTTTYSLTVSDGSGDNGCAPADIYTTTVTVNAKPVAAPTNNGYICNGGTVTLTANPSGGATSYTWAGASLATTTAENPTATPTTTTVYSVTVGDGSGQPGCTPTDVYTTSVTVNAKPVAAPVNNGPICAGGTVTLTATPSGGATTFSWSGTSLSSSSAENPTAIPTSTSIYSVTVTDGSTQPGCSPSDVYTTSVTVRAKPTAAPTNNGYICVGGTANLTANPSGGATVFAWSGSAISSASTQNPTANPTSTTTYSLTVSDGTTDNGCSPSDVYTTTVTVNAKPTAAPSNNGYICNGGTVTLSANPAGGANTYVWSGSAMVTTTAQNPTATPTATSVYSLTVSDGSSQPGCAPTDIYTTSVTVNAKPVAAPINNGPICAGGTVTLTATPSGGANTFNWSGTSLSSSSAENPSATPTTTSVYSLTVTDGSTQPGCSPSDVYTTSVTVKAKPTAAPTNNGYICVGGTANLTANPAGGATVFAWSGSPISSASTQNPTANPTATTTYSLTVSDGSGDNGCAPTDIYTTTVTVNAKPIAAPVNSGILCNGGTVTLNAMPAGGANTYSWSGTSLATSTTQNPTATPSTGTHVYSLTVSDGTSQPGCAPADIYTTEVTVNPAPALTSVTNDGPVCEGITLNFSANGATNVTNYSWAGPVALTGATTATPSVPSSTTAATGTYTVTVSNGTGSGCDVKYTNAAVVHLVPTVVSITPSTTNICVGTAITFTAGTATGAGVLTSYNWSGPNAFSTTTSSGSTTFTTTTTAQSGVYTLTVTYPGTGCTSPQVVTPSVTVNNLPTMVSIGASPSVLCAGATLTLTGNGAFGAGTLLSYNWTGPNSYSSTSSSAAQLYVTPDAAASGSYSVSVTYTGTGCTSVPVASAPVLVNPLPTIYDVNGGGFYCSGGTGVDIELADSDPGISYQLYLGSTADGAPLAGTGSNLNFGTKTAAGTYSVLATNNVTSCAVAMNGTTNVTVGPVPSTYNVVGGGGYCAGGTGVSVGLSNGDVSVGYQLYRDGVPVGSQYSPSSAGAFSFGLFTTPGNYTVIANPTATCNRTMNGSVNVSINPLPNPYTVSGGGNYCAGGTGIHIIQDFSVVGVNYQLYNGSSTVGSPVAGASSGLDFGLQTAAGTYSVRATNATTGCVNGMSGTPSITIDPLPTVFTVSGGGSHCAGATGNTVSISNTQTGVNYQVYNGSTATGAAVAGTGSALTLGTFTAAGTYTVRATNATTGCSNGMSGSAVISINALPTAYAMTGGGTYCSGGTGVHVGLANSQLGVEYALYNGGTLEATMPGASSGLDFGFITNAGTYTVLATNTTTGCVNAMSGSATVSVNPIPQLHTVTGGGTTCENGGGLVLGLDGSNAGISYQLYNGASAVGSAVAGNTLAISFGPYNTPGTYTVLATHVGNGCTRTMSGNAVINVNPAPIAQTVTGGGGYCAGTAGQNIGLATSQINVQYQLYNGSSVASGVFPGDGNPISFGAYTAAGTYSVLATNIATFCTNAMANSVVVSMNPAPSAFNVTGGGTYCSGGAGVNIGLSNSAVGINYQLYRGSTVDGAPVSGTGSSINFGLKTTTGTYTVMAVNSATGCTNGMTGTVNVAVSASPTVYNVTGGGNYCTGTTGSVIGLSGSNVGINYRLYMGATPMGTVVTGTGSAITMSPQTTVGTYSIIATDAGSSCTSVMNGTATVGVNSSPSAFSVTGGGHYCQGGTGVSIGLIGSTSGVNYQLYRDATTVGSPVAGTGMAVSFGVQTVAGTYTVLATDAMNSCTRAMTGSVDVIVDPLPSTQTVNGGGQYCSGGTGVQVGLMFANSGINYQLYNGATAMGSAVPGANSTLSFGFQTAGGTYTVLATDAITGCSKAMSGSATVVVNPLPTIQSVTGGGAFCSDGSGVAVGLSGSQTGVNYQLYTNGTANGMPIGGTGSAFSFGNQTVTGTYTVYATNATTSCARAMMGSATVTSNPAPTVFAVTGGGSLCAGQAGHNIGLAGSQVNVVYNLYNGSTSTGITVNGTGSVINFGTFTTAGVYTVSATHTGTGCTKDMSGGAVIVVNPVPNVQNVTGGGQFCTGGSGVAVGLGGSQMGINYTLYRGAVNTGTTLAGTGSSITFGAQTVAGTYSVLATNATTACTRAMNGTAGVTVNALPAVQSVTGGGSFCAGGSGVNIGLSSSQPGVSYQLYSGATAYGSAAPGTGSVVNFGAVDVAGTYSVRATNYTTACVNNMSGSATVVVNALPTAYAVTGGGSYCTGSTGVTVTLASSETGVSYQLYNGSVMTGSAMSGTGSALSFSGVTPAGTYSILATNSSTGCTKAMLNTTAVSVLPLPTVHTVTGGGTYCAGGAGVNVGLSSSTVGVNYQLYNGATAVGTPFTGSGMTFDFGLQSTLGTYTVLATNIFTGCSIAMNGSTTISTTPLPTAQTVTGGGTYCAGGAGMAVGLSSSEAGISYQLYRGATVAGTPVSGTNSAISFGLQTTAGVYTVLATNTTTGCTKAMTGSATVIVNAVPVAYNVTGGGNYCAGGTGVAIGLSNSAVGTTYQLYYGNTATGSAIAGVGTAISFGNMTSVGTYSVRATIAATGCTSGMTGVATVTTNALPALYSVTGGGSYCVGGGGVPVGLSGSTNGVNYQLYRGATLVGTAPGSGSSISFGVQTVAGNYSVVATNASTACTRNMTGSAIVSINALPAIQTVSGGGSYCAGGTGVNVGLTSTEGGVNYQLYRNGAIVGSPVIGTGTALDFGVMATAGTYSVSASNATTACMSDMAGTAIVSINALPDIHTITGGGSYCTGGTGVAIGLNGSEVGVAYQLYNGATAVGSAVNGTGNAISFGLKTAAGTYSVVATNLSTTCMSAMSGTTSITINPLPTTYTVSGGGSFCAGGTGVNVTLSGSGSSISYQLYNGASAMGAPVTGTGGMINFGAQTLPGTYSVMATNTGTGCARAMTGTATVSTNTQPTVFAITGGGAYCAGGAGQHIGLAASTIGVNYQLYFGPSASGSPVAGTGGAIDFGLKTTVGTYSVAAVNATTGCSANMSGTATISINALPTVQTVNGGGAYCAGGTGVFINLSGSETGVDYQLYNGASSVGAATHGTGGGLTFGLQTAAGTYSVLATNVGTGCARAMTGATSVIVNAAPAVFNMTGGGSYCSGGNGVAVGLSGSTVGVSYKLYNGTTFVSTTLGTGSALNFGMKTAAGDYNVVATTAAGCTMTMAGASTVVVNATPVAYTITGGGNYCAGGTGVNVGLSGSAIGVNYQLYNGSSMSGSAVAGTGNLIEFGMKTAAGTYSVVAVDPTSSCSRTMTGTVAVGINALPTVQTVTGGGSYCANGSGVAVGLGGSQTGVNYQLYNGATASGTAVAGTGAAINFGMRTAAGMYTVKASNGSTGCMSDMAGSATIMVNELPVVHTVTGGGNICTGSTGVNVGLNGSTIGINYRLYNGTVAVGGTVAGTGNALNFGTFTTAGTYSVQAMNTTTGCVTGMAGMATVVINPLPTVYSMTGGGTFCAGGNGVFVGISNSQPGVNYHLHNGSTVVLTAAGTGGILNFGRQTEAGVYTVVAENATTGCTRNMAGSSTVTITALPVAQNVTGGGAYCAGSGGVSIGLESSQAGVNYQLYEGVNPSGSIVAGNGMAISFGMRTNDGTYTVKATDATQGCVNTMTGSATVLTNALPAAFNVTGGGNYCAGGEGRLVGLDGSAMNVNYTLYNGTTAVAGPIAGTDNPIWFGLQTLAGSYTVRAADVTTGCTRTMTGSANITIDALPTAQTLTASAASYCAGGTGVNVMLSGSSAGVTYMLYNGATQVASIAGTNAAISFGSMTAAGTYTAKAVNNTTGCISSMTGSANISINPLPSAYPVTGGGAICAGSEGVAVGVAGSEFGINYVLKMGSATIGTPVAGNGDAVSFGLKTNAGNYTVMAVNAATGCSKMMSGSAIISINALPTAFSVTGGGSYCAGGNGVHVGLSNTQTDVTYQLYKDGIATGGAVAGTGNLIDFGAMTAGTYSVMATNAMTSCMRAMTGSVMVSMNALPEAVNVTGGGSYCAGGTGVAVGISNSVAGVSYRLYRGSTLVATAAGTGSALNFGTYTVAGTYTVSAMNSATGCGANMTGSATININALPVVQTVTGGGSYCAGGTGVAIGLGASQSGVQYQLYMGTMPIGGSVSGTGSAISFGEQVAAGSYSVMATSTASCSRSMLGSANVSITPIVTPLVTMTMSTESTVCAGTEVTYTANVVNGGTAPTYNWMVNGAPAGVGAAAYTYTPANGDVVSVQLTSNAACATPAIANASVNMTVNARQTPVVNITSDHAGTICRGTSVTFTATSEFGGTAPVYSWMRNGVLQSTGAMYTVAPNDGDEVTATLTSNFECRTSNTATSNTLTTDVVDPLNPVVQITADATTLIEGQPVTFTAILSGAGTSPDIQWLINGDEVPGAITTSFITNLLQDKDTVSVRITATSPCGEKEVFATVVVNMSAVGVAGVDVKPMDVRIMPNPNNGTFVIKGSLGSAITEDVQAEVTNMLGQIVYRDNIKAIRGTLDHRITLDGSLANGIYLLNIKAGDKSQVFYVTVGK